MSVLPLVENSHDFERLYGVYLRSTHPPKWLKLLTRLEQMMYFYPSVSKKEAKYWFDIGYAMFFKEHNFIEISEYYDSIVNDVDVPPNKECEMFHLEGWLYTYNIWYSRNNPTPYEQRGGLCDVELSNHDRMQAIKWRNSHGTFNTYQYESDIEDVRAIRAIRYR
jgi:hypothetical protein